MPDHDCWWTMHSSHFLEAMRRAHDGEDPEILYIEFIANSETKRYDKDGDET